VLRSLKATWAPNIWLVAPVSNTQATASFSSSVPRCMSTFSSWISTPPPDLRTPGTPRFFFGCLYLHTQRRCPLNDRILRTSSTASDRSMIALTRSNEASSLLWATFACSFWGLDLQSRAQWPILPHSRHSSHVGFPDPLLESFLHPLRPLPRPRPPLPRNTLELDPPPGLLATSFFYLAIHSSFVRYNFPSCCIIVGSSSKASSASFSRLVKSATLIIDSVLMVMVIYLNCDGRLRIIFSTT
jgi:hypothetical protein